MGKIAYIFPGQGSQTIGMGKDLYDNFSIAKSVFEEADKSLGFSISEICFEGPNDLLTLTENTQPAILTTSIAALRVMEERGFPAPDFVAGHSLGEYSAIVAAGSIGLPDAAKIVFRRGQFMQEAVPVGVGAMAAIIGLSLEKVEAACAESAGDEICSAANINTKTQIVIAGSAGAVERACVRLKEMGARRAMRLNVSAPFHCDLMKPAEERLADVLADVKFLDPRIPLIENVSAKENSKGERIREALISQVTSPVRWLDSVQFMIDGGVETFVEIGAKKILSGLVRQINGDVRCLSIEDSESLEKAIEEISEG